MKNTALKTNIDEFRIFLDKIVDAEGFQSSRVLKASEELDKMIIAFYMENMPVRNTKTVRRMHHTSRVSVDNRNCME